LCFIFLAEDNDLYLFMLVPHLFGMRETVMMLLTQVCCAKVAKPIEVPFGRLTNMHPGNRVLDGDRNRSNPLAAVGRCGLFPNYFEQ